jgi:hypothetical protein
MTDHKTIFRSLRKSKDDPVTYLVLADAIEEQGDADTAAKIRKQGQILRTIVETVPQAVLPWSWWDDYKHMDLPDGFSFTVRVRIRLVYLRVWKPSPYYPAHENVTTMVTQLHLQRHRIAQAGDLEKRARQVFRLLDCEVEGLSSR